MPIYWVGATSGTVDSSARIASTKAIAPVRAAMPQVESASGAGLRAKLAYQTQQEPAPPRPILLVRDLMTTTVIALQSSDTIDEAIGLFRERRFRHLPVVESDGTLVGILSDRDVLRGTANPDRTDAPSIRPAHIADLMSVRVLTATADTAIREVARVMVSERLGALPVIDDEHKVIGIVTSSDLLRCIINQPGLELWG